MQIRENAFNTQSLKTVLAKSFNLSTWMTRAWPLATLIYTGFTKLGVALWRVGSLLLSLASGVKEILIDKVDFIFVEEGVVI